MERARAVGEQSKYHSHKQPLASQSGDFVGPDTPQTDGHALPASSSQTNSPEFRALLLHHIQTFQNGRNASTLILAQLRSGLSGLSGTVCSGIFVLLWLCASMDPCDVKSFNPLFKIVWNLFLLLWKHEIREKTSQPPWMSAANQAQFAIASLSIDHHHLAHSLA
jgi:hypothetical protein